MRRVVLLHLSYVMMPLAGCHSQPAQMKSAPAPAATTASAKSAAPKFNYLGERAAELESVLPPPPADRGPLSRGEIELMLALRAEASDAVRTRAKSEEILRGWTFADVLGPGFTKEKMPLTGELLHRAEQDANVVTDRVRASWPKPRVRPPNQDTRMTPLFAVPNGASYPSGHSIRAMMFARVLAMLAPDKKDELLQRARLVAYDRLVAGVHFPSDVAAGLELGSQIADQLALSPQFQADLELARAEWKRR